MNELFIKSGKAIVTDEGHWITVNGNHVLINEKGEVMAGLGGKFNGRRISKFEGKFPKTKEEINAARKVAGEKSNKAREEMRAVENSKDYKKAEREIKRIDKEMESRWYRPWANPERHASLEALRQQYQDQKEAMYKAPKRRYDEASKREDNLYEREKDGKNGIFTNLTAKRNRLTKNIANAERNIAARQAKIKAKVDAVKAKYNKMAERVEKSNIAGVSPWERRHLASSVQRRGEERAQNIERTAREGSMWAERKKEALYANKGDLKWTNKKINALEKFKNNIKPKLANPAKANEFIANAKGTRVSKATPSMLGGKFTNAQKEQKESYNRYRTEMNRADKEVKKASAEREKVYEELNKKEERLGKDLNKSIKYGQAAVRVGMLNPKYKKLSERLMERQNQKYKDYEEGRKESDVRANEADRKYREVYERNADRETKAGERHIANGYKIGRKLNEVKKALAKARPKIAERREAIARYNQATSPKTSSSKITTRFDKDYAKAEKSFEDFQDVMNRRQNEINVLQERLRTTKNGFIAKATKQDLDKAVREYNELDQMY